MTVIFAGLLAASLARPDPQTDSIFGNFDEFTSQFQQQAEKNLEGLADLIDDVGHEINEDVADIKHPIDTAIFQGIDVACSTVKGLIGVKYDQIDTGEEPDLNKLTLDFITPAYTITFNIKYADQTIPEAKDFNEDQKLYIFIHGFTDKPTKEPFTNIRKALFSQGKSNVIALDGSKFIGSMYLRSTTYVRFIGEKLGKVLASMVDHGVDPAQIHVIGHSLGAHIASFTGKTFTKLTGKKVARITGLDPAGPCFGRLDEELRLKKTDADFVDVVHTDGLVKGLLEAVGDVDYYPNAGQEQPGCLTTHCSHHRAWQYFTESVVNQQAFPAVKCDSWEDFKKGSCEDLLSFRVGHRDISYMGFPSKPGTTGKYYLQTDDKIPFSLGINGTTYRNTNGIIGNIVDGLLG
ncbi:lipase domain-containing protein [Phthorimaea operculella]|nr:lipase domain-containing protein [Phthorimaea operculella]